MSYSIPIYNENQYANLFTFRRKGVCIFSSYNWMNKTLLKGYTICDCFFIDNVAMVEQNSVDLRLK